MGLANTIGLLTLKDCLPVSLRAEKCVERPRQLGGVLEIKGLNQERICAKVVGFIRIADVVRIREHDHAQFKKFPLLANPPQHFKPVHPRHYDV